MTTANSTFVETELDYSGIKSNLINFMRSQPQFTDYNYEGSNLSRIIDLLSFNTHYNAMYLNMMGNELFGDTAILRSSVISHSKLQNYTPKSSNAPSAFINLQINNVLASSLTLPKFTKFTSEQINGVNYTFTTVTSTTVNAVTNTVNFNNVEIKQGQPVSIQFTVDTVTNPSLYFKIPDGNIDTSTLEVIVQNSNIDPTQFTYTLATDYLLLGGTSKVYFIQESLDGYYEIYFGDGVLGKYLSDSNIIKLSYLVTSSSASNGANNFSMIDTVSGYGNYKLTPITAATLGQDKESIESIRFNYTKNVTGSDIDKYNIAIKNNQVVPVDAVSIWGGEDNYPPIYNRIFICIKPTGGYTITEYQKVLLLNDVIKPNAIRAIPEIIDVDYTWMSFVVDVIYNQKKTTLDSETLRLAVIDYVKLLSLNTLNAFDSQFIKSSYINKIYTVDNSIISVDLNYYTTKKIYPVLKSTNSYTVDFSIPLKKGTFSSNSFKYADLNNILRNEVFLEEVNVDNTSIQNIQILNAGHSYTKAPTIEIVGDGYNAAAHTEIVNGRITNVIIDNVGTGYTQAIISVVGDGSGASLLAILNNNINKLRMYFYLNGVKTIISEIGTIDYNTGIITLDAFSPYDINNTLGELQLKTMPSDVIITNNRNKMLTLDTYDNYSVVVNVRT